MGRPMTKQSYAYVFGAPVRRLLKTTTELPGALMAIYLSILAAPALATSITFTGIGTVNGRPVNAQAILTTGTNSVSISLTNLQSNPSDIVQTLSDLDFTLSTT